MQRYEIIKQLFAFLKKEKKFWLYPIIIVLILLGILIVLGESSVVAPFIYSLF
jgi:competence protein ComGC